MADKEKGKTGKVDPKLDVESLKQIKDLTDQIVSGQIALNEATSISAAAGRETLNTILEQRDAYEKLANLKQKAAEDESSPTKKAALRAESVRLKDLHQHLDRNRAAYEDSRDAINQYGDQIDKLLPKAMSLDKRLQSAAANKEKFNESFLEKEGFNVVSIGAEMAGAGVQGLMGAFDGLTAKLAAVGLFMRGVSFRSAFRQVRGMAGELDTSFRSIMKSGFDMAAGVEKSFLAIIDPISAVKFNMISTAEAGKMFVDVGITAKDTGEAFLALKKNSMIFTKDFVKNNVAITAQAGNLIAAYKKLGVPVEQSSKALDVLTKGLKKTPREALKATKSLVKIASSLDISTAKAFQDFNALMPTLAQFGDRAIEVFGNLEAQARATGVQVNKLAKFAEGLDTFQGAAKAAQGFNAMLNGTYISVTDLVHAEPHKKIDLIRDAFKRAGMEIDMTNRRHQQMAASLTGMGIEDTRRLFGSEKDYKKVRDSLDTTSTSAEDMMKKLENQMTSADVLKKSLSSLAGGMTKLVKIGRTTAKEGSAMLVKSFENIRDSTDDSVKSITTFMGLLKGLSAPGKGAGIGLGIAGALNISPEQWEAIKGSVEDQVPGSWDALKNSLKDHGLLPDFLGSAPGAAGVPQVAQGREDNLERNRILDKTNKILEGQNGDTHLTVHVQVGDEDIIPLIAKVVKETVSEAMGAA